MGLEWAERAADLAAQPGRPREAPGSRNSRWMEAVGTQVQLPID